MWGLGEGGYSRDAEAEGGHDGGAAGGFERDRGAAGPVEHPDTVAEQHGDDLALELVDASLAAIDVHGARTNAFIRVDAESARAAARLVDDETRRGIDRGPLHGMPISIKDLIDVAGEPTTAASNVRPKGEHVASHDALFVQRHLGASGLPAELVITKAVPRITISGTDAAANASVHLDLDGELH